MSELDGIANIAANFEKNFNIYKTKPKGGKLNGFEIIDVFQYDGSSSQKGIALKDEAGNIYVHFNGTGDGNWKYNAVAYGGSPSDLQNKALEWFNDVVKKNVEGQSVKEFYVSGHSQGGNNAQFVTMRSPYADYITNCISLDGPGFSKKFVSDSIDLYGEAFYDRQRSKIYAYNGENDYVSCLGQKSIVLDENTVFVEYTNPDNKKIDFEKFHAIEGMLDKNGKLIPKKPNGDSAFRKYVVQALEKVRGIQPEAKQTRAAELVMKLCENMEGSMYNGSMN